MPLPFACPHCGEQTLVEDEFAGHSGPCVNCGRLIIVPRFAVPRAGAAGVAGSPYANLPRASAASRYLLIGLVTLGATVGIIALFAILFQPMVEYWHAGAHRRECGANLRKIGAAIMAYETQYGSLPPAYVEDKDGNRLYSWRVLILPFLGPSEQALAREFNYAEAWDSPHNQKVTAKIPGVFRCPGDEQLEKPEETSYFVIVGNRTAFPGETSVNRSQITDGPRQTIYVVEAPGLGIAWTEPRDLTDSAQGFQIGVEVGGNHPRGTNMLLGNGEVKFFPDSLDPDVLHSMSTINGGETVPDY